MGQRHNLESIVVMNNDATMNEGAGKFNGMTREEARKQVVAELDELGLLEKSKIMTMRLVIVPVVKRLLNQWFLNNGS